MLTRRQREFGIKVSQLAREVAPGCGLDWRLIAAVAILESGWGESRLATEGLNCFGIKATSRSRPEGIIEIIQAGKKVAFRKYESMEESFRDFGKLLSKSKHYAKARTESCEAALTAFIDAMSPVYCPDDGGYRQKITQIIRLLERGFSVTERKETA